MKAVKENKVYTVDETTKQQYLSCREKNKGKAV